VASLGGTVIHGAAWNPWSNLIALSITSPGTPSTTARVLLADSSGKATGFLHLPFTGAGRLEWSNWTGERIGITRMTPRGTEAWEVTLPPLPADPAASLG